METTTPSISVVIPVYNSRHTLPPLVARLEEVLSALSAPFEIILVNDGSPDDSWTVIRDLAERYPFIHAINLVRNFGQHNALLCGIREANHDIIVTMDDDLQHPPEEIPNLLHQLEKGHDVVYGFPKQERHGLLRDLASMTTKRVMSSAMGVKGARNISAFRVFHTRLRDAFAGFSGPGVSIDVLLSWATTRFGGCAVEHHPRTIGQSGYTVIKLARHAINMITGFTTIPLRIASLVGFSFLVVGFALLAFVAVRYLMDGGSVPGFPFLASVVVVFAGVQLFALGIIGEYLGQVHRRLMDRPSYVVREKLSQEPAIHGLEHQQLRRRAG